MLLLPRLAALQDDPGANGFSSLNSAQLRDFRNLQHDLVVRDHE
jgi:hypothetical protein